MVESQELIVAALNGGDITPSEARELQGVVAQAWHALKEAESAPPDLRNSLSPEDARRLVVQAATGFGMVWPADQGPEKTG